MQIVSDEVNLHEMSKPVYWENKKNIAKCCLLKILPRVLSVKVYMVMKISHKSRKIFSENQILQGMQSLKVNQNGLIFNKNSQIDEFFPDNQILQDMQLLKVSQNSPK